MLFLAGVGEEGDLDGRGGGGEEGEFGLGPAGVLLDLLPQVEVLLELLLLVGILLIEYDRIVLILLGVQKLPDKLAVHRLLLLHLRTPPPPLPRQVPQG